MRKCVPHREWPVKVGASLDGTRNYREGNADMEEGEGSGRILDQRKMGRLEPRQVVCTINLKKKKRERESNGERVADHLSPYSPLQRLELSFERAGKPKEF